MFKEYWREWKCFERVKINFKNCKNKIWTACSKHWSWILWVTFDQLRWLLWLLQWWYREWVCWAYCTCISRISLLVTIGKPIFKARYQELILVQQFTGKPYNKVKGNSSSQRYWEVLWTGKNLTLTQCLQNPQYCGRKQASQDYQSRQTLKSWAQRQRLQHQGWNESNALSQKSGCKV